MLSSNQNYSETSSQKSPLSAYVAWYQSYYVINTTVNCASSLLKGSIPCHKYTLAKLNSASGVSLTEEWITLCVCSWNTFCWPSVHHHQHTVSHKMLCIKKAPRVNFTCCNTAFKSFFIVPTKLQAEQIYDFRCNSGQTKNSYWLA